MNINLFGERCSGTNYLFHLVQKNFENVNINTHRFGWKHWFPGTAGPGAEVGKHAIQPCMQLEESTDNDIFLVVFRDPYDWIRSMSKEPHHAHDHFYLPFSKFIRREWKCYYGPYPDPENIHDDNELMCERNQELLLNQV